MSKYKINDIIVCIDNVDYDDRLTLGKHYKVIEIVSPRLVTFRGDDGELSTGFIKRFSKVKKHESLPKWV